MPALTSGNAGILFPGPREVNGKSLNAVDSGIELSGKRFMAGTPPPVRLLDALRDRIRLRHYSLRTERAYVQWARRYIRFHGRRHPRELREADVTAFLGSLATVGGVSASTQNQALAALLFLYKEVLGIELAWLENIPRARRPRRLPTVLTREEAHRVLAQMSGTHALMARMLYGTGMRLTECLCLRVKDLELERREILIREGKGGKDRVTVLPASLVESLRDHLVRVRALFERDRASDVPGVELPGALARKSQELNELNKKRGELLDKLSELHDKVFALRQQTARTISKQLEPDIRVSITQFGERSEYADRLREALKGQGRHYTGLVARIEQHMPPRELVRLVERRAASELATTLELRDEQADWLIDRLSAAEDGKLMLDLEALQLEDRPKIELCDGGTYKDASTLSTGQKCTTILPILLLDSDRPLLIDQPEDNLDNAFIYETVVRNIAEVKHRRQLIFVTHNPNIPVLGDAEMVFVTESDGQHGRVRVSGDVERVKVEIEQILEGGAEAFLERKRRYGH